MSDQDYVVSLVQQWKSNLDSDDYNEDLSVEMLGEIERLSPEAYEQIKCDYNWDDLMKRYS